MIDSLGLSIPQEDGSAFSRALRKVATRPYVPFLLGGLFIVMDLFSGPFIQFPVTFVIPVALAAWFGTKRNWLLLAIGQPALNCLIAILTDTGLPGMPPPMIIMNSAIRATVLVILGYFIWRSSNQNRELKKRVGLLRSEIPTCIGCGKAQDEGNNWLPMPLYISRHTGANFSDAICPSCKSERFSA